MKTLLFTFYLLLSTFTLFAQNNFKAENGALIWQKVYDTPKGANVETLATQLAATTISATNITGSLASSVNYTAQGVKRMQMPLYMNEDFTAAVNIEIKPDRYRVTVNSILFTDIESSMYRNATQKQTNITEYCVNKKGEIRQSQTKALNIFSNDLNTRFTINPSADNW